MFNIKNLPPVERKLNGSLPQMVPRQRQEAIKLIKQICCNYNNGNCILLDTGEPCICPQSITYSINCKFFRHILLEDKEGQSLKAEIFRDETTKHCSICNKAFQSTSNNAKYCRDCARNIQRKQKADYIRKRRANVEK